MEQLNETIRSIPDLTAMVGQIGTLREYSARLLAQGETVPEDVIGAMLDSMQELGSILPEESGMGGWIPFLEQAREGQMPPDFPEKIAQWEADVLRFLDELPRCGLCGKRAAYLPKTDYYRRQQKAHGFRYWNAVMESLSYRACQCPNCQALDRDRLIALFLDRALSEDGGTPKRVLQIAPSPALDAFLRRRRHIVYDTTDLQMEGVTFRSDIQQMDGVPDRTYDVIVCSHVLEHVEDDRKAMRELRRILKDDGVCLFLVPLVIGLDRTDEAFGLSAEENWRRFGQNDHARLYAKEDFLDRLTEAGFLVYPLKEAYFGTTLWRQNGLSDIHCLYAAAKRDIGLGTAPYRKRSRDARPLVSVVVPTYNRADCVAEAVSSVLRQTYPALEVIVVDDGSTDRTAEVIGGIDDPRLRYIRLEENRGANHARNVGIQNAAGAYVAFQDSDDVWLPEKLEKQMKLMLLEEDGSLGGVYCVMTRYRNGNRLFSAPKLEDIGENAIGFLRDFMLGCMFVSTQTLVLKKSVLEEVGGFAEPIRRLQDWELLLRVSGKYRLTLVQESLVDGRTREDAVSNNNSNCTGAVDTICYVLDRYECRYRHPHAYRRLIAFCTSLMHASSDSALTEAYRGAFLEKLRSDRVLSAEQIEAAADRIAPAASARKIGGGGVSDARFRRGDRRSAGQVRNAGLRGGSKQPRVKRTALGAGLFQRAERVSLAA